MGEETTSSGAGATPLTGSPATGTAPAGATPKSTSLNTLEEALARIAELEHSHKNATEERDRQRKKLSTYEEAEKKAQDAALSEVEKVNRRATEAEQQAQKYRQELISAQVQLAAQKRNIIDPELAALALTQTLEYGEDGMPSNLDKALDELMKNKPHLVAKPDAVPPSPAQTASAPAIPAMNPGRSSIMKQNPTPGKIPRLTDPDMFKR
jgi:hypothetical protein